MSNFCKYKKLKQQVSYDSGQTWVDTGIYVRGDLIEYQSEDCPDYYVFTLSGGSQSTTVPFGYETSAHTFSIVSTLSGNPVMYTSEVGYLGGEGSGWITCQATGNDGDFVVTCHDNIYNSGRSGYVKLKQSGSEKEITINIIQSGGTWDYLFLWADSTTSKTVNVSSAASSLTLNVTSYYYHYPSAPTNRCPFEAYYVTGLTYSRASDYSSVTVSWDANMGASEVVRVLVLHQLGGDNIINLEIHQAPN